MSSRVLRHRLAAGAGAALLAACLSVGATWAATGPSGPARLADTATSSTTSTGTTSSTTASSATSSGTTTATTASGTTTASTTTGVHDARYFSQTGYRIDDDTIYDYFQRRGGLATFGYPVSRTFRLQGFTVQLFQRRIVQLGPRGHARLLNTLDPGLLPYTGFNGSTFPAPDAGLVAQAPDPTDQPAVLAFVKAHAPDSFDGQPVDFYQTFAHTVSGGTAFPAGGDTHLLPGFDLELWGVPTSQPTVDPANHNFVYLRFQRGIMHYDASNHTTQGILLADYLKAILTGQNLPADLKQEAANSPFYQQYDPTQPKSVRNPGLLPNTDLTNAFVPE